MTKLSKRIKQMREAVDPNKFYSLSDALGLAKQNSTAKFDESIDIAVILAWTPRSRISWSEVPLCFRREQVKL
jgi:large subunit ribosomal protein L1